MVKAVFDTNILIDYLNGVPQARDELARYDTSAISVVTWMEVLAGAKPQLESGTRVFLERFTLINLDGAVAEKAVDIRKKSRLRLPDAIIWASAQVHAMLLVTRNTKDFVKDEPGIRIPYKL
jgi:predicted nucleic acid-binding protein